jgi:hypothetical protein
MLLSLGGTMTQPYGLEFSKIKSARCSAYGVLTDDQGNTFGIEIKGTNEEDVRRFINYERRQVKAGKGIKVSVESSQSLIAPLTGATPPKQVKHQATWRGVSIKIRELQVNVERPYKLHFTIDPPIQAGEVRDFPLDNQPTADVNCKVSKGNVKIELFEFIDNVKSSSISVGSGNVSAGQPQGFSGIHSQHTGNWNVRVTGQTSSNFTLELDLFIL